MRSSPRHDVPRTQDLRRITPLQTLSGCYSTTRGLIDSTKPELRGRATLLTEVAEVEKVRAPGVLQLTPTALDRYLQALVQELRSGIQGKVRDALERTVGKITVDMDGTMTIEAKPDGVLGIEGPFAPLWCRGSGPPIEQNRRPKCGCLVSRKPHSHLPINVRGVLYGGWSLLCEE